MATYKEVMAPVCIFRSRELAFLNSRQQGQESSPKLTGFSLMEGDYAPVGSKLPGMWAPKRIRYEPKQTWRKSVV